jgi:hypothetical protein
MEFFATIPPKPEEPLSGFDKYLIEVARSRVGIRRKILTLKKYLKAIQENGVL